jgi:hypothetical protein
MGVLEKLNVKNLKLGRCGEALFMLRDAVGKYSGVFFAKGKALELVLMSSLLLFSRSNEQFSPSIFCNAYQCAEDLETINLCGGAVEIMDVQRFPSCSYDNMQAVSSTEIIGLVSKLSPGSRGGVFIPKDPYNLNGDVFGLFKTDTEDHWALLVFQCKDWFLDTAEGSNIVTKWKKNRKDLFPPKNKINFIFENRIQTIQIFHILFSSNELEEKANLQCIESDGAGTLKTMREWLPTAAYACEGAHKLREIFSPLDAVDTGSDGKVNNIA